ncbi:kinase-like domain-containing protein [Gamsiella multidivaricata]|uniref:kinase-like domain-containing protein n=1 Tax=Gamsiella multidivaricata TaxID=101098 RepID=UPI0022203E1F|nr:kinase-like domain-containing protein [Gamsiella multidivaricata]KAI7820967.1 kinase-like domain-containing protein [Gamsiella multidivaricata]
MNTAAPTQAPTHTQQIHAQDTAAYIRPEAHAADRISAQEAMKGMRISEPHQHNSRQRPSDTDDAYVASRVERHLASRAQSIRASSKQQTEELALKVALTERRRSPPENITTTAPVAFDIYKPMEVIPEPNASSKITCNNLAQGSQSRQPQSYSSQDPDIVAPSQQHDQGSRSGPTQQFHNQKAPIPPSPSTNDNVSPTSPQPIPSSGRQSNLSSVSSSSKESYRRKYGDIQGYTYIGTIGQGNFGKVLLAENDITGEHVAVKILEKAQFKSEQQRLHATREARLMATLRHPNIVDVKTVMEDDYRILIVMENLTGGELFDYISNKGSLDEEEARRIFQQIVLAIHYCHENKVVHRDLKPENILLDSERNVRVADFGFGNNWHKDRHLTTYCGSPFYAAPEMVSGTPYIGPETDVWSLGVILYVLVCGRLPFDASDLPALFAQIKRGNYQKPREGSIDVCSLIHRMLTVDPKRRATLADVLRSRWMRADGMESLATALPALSTALPTIRSASVHQQQQQQQAGSTVLGTHHPNNDISTTMAAPGVHTGQNRHSYHPPGAHELDRQQQQQQESPSVYRSYQHSEDYQQDYRHQHHRQSSQSVLPRELRDSDDQMSDVSPSMVSSPTETMATISPCTPVAPTCKNDVLGSNAAANNATTLNGCSPAVYQKRPTPVNGVAYDEKHHPYKHHHSRTSSVHSHGCGQSPEAVMINMCPSNDVLMDSYDTSSKKKRKALTKLRQFFRFETNKTHQQ